MDFSFTWYFQNRVLDRRPYITRGMCIRVVRNPVRVELQTDRKRVRFWAVSYTHLTLPTNREV